MTKPMLTRVPDELHARVKDEADKRGVSMTKIVIAALEEYLSAIHLSADFVVDERYRPQVGGLIAIRISREELDKVERSLGDTKSDGAIRSQNS